MEKLLSNAYERCETLGDIWDRTAEEYEDAPCMGTRQLLRGEEIQKDGKSFLHLEFGSYMFESFNDVNDRVLSIIAWFNSIGLKRGDHVVIFAETRAEWMQSAIACFKYGLPGRFNFTII
jgi:long-chain acyl-CoA synthetase